MTSKMIYLLRMVAVPLSQVAGHQNHFDSAHKRQAQRRRATVPRRTSCLQLHKLKSRAFPGGCVEAEALLTGRSEVVVSAEAGAEAGRTAHLTATMTGTRLELRVEWELPYVRI